MKKFLFIIGWILFLMSISTEKTVAQYYEYSGWQVSIGTGYMDYYGDVSPYRILHWKDWAKTFKFFRYNSYYNPDLNIGLSVEKRFTPGMGLLFQVNKETFVMSDRFLKPNGAYDFDAPHWNRALNFKNNMWDAGFALTFHSDNGKLLKKDALVAPYVFMGAGVSYFKIKGDLYDAKGKPYDYADPTVYPDGKYETNLRPLKTELNKKYPNFVGYADVGVGVKFRLSKVISLTLQTDIKYSFSDYLDDVSGYYKTYYPTDEEFYAALPGTNDASDFKRGYADRVNDFYTFNKLAIQFTIGRKNSHRDSSVHTSKRPIFPFTGNEKMNEKDANETDTMSQKKEQRIAALEKTLDSLRSRKLETDTVWLNTENKDSLNKYKTTHLEADIFILRYHLDSLKKLNTYYKDVQMKQSETIDSLRNRVDSLNHEITRIKEQQALKNQEDKFPVASIYFMVGSPFLTQKETNKLRPIVVQARKDSSLMIVLKAFTDASGSVRINKMISEKRANAVKEVFMKKYKIAPSRIRIQPSVMAKAGEGSNALNRRVDIRLKKK